MTEVSATQRLMNLELRMVRLETLMLVVLGLSLPGAAAGSGLI